MADDLDDMRLSDESNVGAVDHRGSPQPARAPIRVILIDVVLGRFVSAARVARNLGDDSVRQPRIVPVILDDECRSSLRLGIRRGKVDDHDISALERRGTHTL